MSLRELIQSRIAELAINQATLAKRAGLRQSFITDVMQRRKVRIQPRFIEPLAKALEVTPDELYGSMTALLPSNAHEARPTGDAFVLKGSLIEPWYNNKEFSITTGAGRSVIVFNSASELTSSAAWASGKASVRYRWPITLSWTRGAYALLEERSPYRGAKNILLIAPQVPIRTGDYCVVFMATNFSVRIFKQTIGTKIEFDCEGPVAGQKIRRVHRLLGWLDADPN